MRRTFLNDTEYAAVCLVDGRPMSVVVDDNEVVERAKLQMDRTDGVYKRQFLIYVAARDFGKLPAPGRELQFERSMYRVVDATREGDLYAITLGANRS